MVAIALFVAGALAVPVIAFIYAREIDDVLAQVPPASRHLLNNHRWE